MGREVFLLSSKNIGKCKDHDRNKIFIIGHFLSEIAFLLNNIIMTCLPSGFLTV